VGLHHTVGALTYLLRGTIGDINAVPGGADIGHAVLAAPAIAVVHSSLMAHTVGPGPWLARLIYGRA
jgi:hypothetical protein